VPVEADRWTDSRCLRAIGLDRLGVFEAVDQGVNRAAAGKACGKQDKGDRLAQGRARRPRMGQLNRRIEPTHRFLRPLFPVV
jgi:hypothetical protein